MQIDKKISPGQGHAMVSIGGHEVKGQGHMRPSYIWNHGGDIILHPLSRIDKGIGAYCIPLSIRLKESLSARNVAIEKAAGCFTFNCPPPRMADMRLADALVCYFSNVFT